MIKQLYDMVLRLASHPKAEMWLFLVAFAESSFFPIPPDVLLIPMCLVAFNKAFRYAAICTIGSVLGGAFGYAIGRMFFDTVGAAVIDIYGIQEKFADLQSWYDIYDWAIITVAGFSPIPYKIFTILSGMVGMNIVTFLTMSFISRGLRFFLIAWLLWRGGLPFKAWIEDNMYALTMGASIILILGIVVYNLLVG